MVQRTKNEFLDLSAVMRRRLAARVWVPLRLHEEETEGEYGEVGYKTRFDGAHSIMVPAEHRQHGEKYGWSSTSDARPWAEADFYKPADIYSHNRETDVGIKLVLRQDAVGEADVHWHLHQDLVIALRLTREKDSWVRPEEDYAEVVRLRRGQDGLPSAIEIKAEYLRDYLNARNASLRIASYFSRRTVDTDMSEPHFKDGSDIEEADGGRYESMAYAVDSSGSPYGSKVAMFRMFRTDVDGGEDVPLMGPETGENTDGESWTHERGGDKFWSLSTEFLRDEWFEQGAASPRVRGDHVPSQVSFIVEADGTRLGADDLDDQDIGRWLWFSPQVIVGLANRRGGNLRWYTRFTGGIGISGYSPVHFGLNERGLVNIYAYDVASLPEWERRYWAGFNVAPEGGVSAELLSAQVDAVVAKTTAPESDFAPALHAVAERWKSRYQTELLREHDEAGTISRQVHRMRALDAAGLLALAKDIARLTADSIDASVAQAVGLPPKGNKPGSLKSVEQALATICGPALARSVMGPLFAVYELRLSDAHLPRADKAQEFDLLKIHEDDLPIVQGYKMIWGTVAALNQIAAVLDDFYPGSERFERARSAVPPA
ncbi:hypothetical protein E5673_08925 [Sphingomonas sp. PAMC26645]|uniref:hypothetical protein n=1 Tax=Sphingomonas sp. PAMC26645 TaxID=2565555 RepID=UPI00109DFD36|nr:hypothetical protein [Sphingomonas sp. PAMC26645]QCB42339.1 hypothetical protein E5673_08925 [Sphingomonas sp. PAMC26645]